MHKITLWFESIIFVTKRIFSGGNPVRDLKEAHADPLTGIANRKKGIEVLSFELARAGMNGGSAVTVGFIDLDGLKAMNDSQGHEAGDEMIQSFVDVLPHYFRRYGEISAFARLGGDEFILVTTMNPSDFEKRIEWVQENGGTSFSFGVAIKKFIKQKRLSKPEAHELAETMIKEADEKMYQNKKARKTGRDFKK